MWDPASIKQLTVRNAIAKLTDIATIAASVTPGIANETGFMPAYKLVQCAPVEVRQRVLQDFRFLGWVGSTLQALHEVDLVNLQRDPRWRRHLITFGLFGVGVALREGTPFTATLILHEGSQVIPATGKLITLRRANVESVTVRVTPNSGILLDESPVDLEDLKHVNGLELGADGSETSATAEVGLRAILRAEIDFDVWASLVGDAFELIEQHPSSVTMVRSFVQALVPIEMWDAGIHFSTSSRAVPGFVFLSVSEAPFDIAEALVHEADHQLLYCLEALSPLLKTGGTHEKLLFRSPWREDPRPMQGIVFGASAFVRVGLFWSALAGLADDPSDDRMGEKATVALTQSLMALSTINEYAELTPAGLELAGALRSLAEQALLDLGSMSAFRDWTSVAQRVTGEHTNRWALLHGPGPLLAASGGETAMTQRHEP